MNNTIKLSTFFISAGGTFIVLGICISIYGISIIDSFQEKPFNRHEAKEIVPGVRNEIGHWLDVKMENDRRLEQDIRSRNTARPYIVTGVVIIIVGFLPLIWGLVQKKNETQSIERETLSSTSKKHCKKCGTAYDPSINTSFCQQCGNKLIK